MFDGQLPSGAQTSTPGAGEPMQPAASAATTQAAEERVLTM
jgi:hypothetical protein